MADDSAVAPRKQERDCTKDVDDALKAVSLLASTGNIQDAIDKLLATEKITRTAADLASSTRVINALLDLLWQARRLDLLNHNISLISRRHGQLRVAVQRMVEKAVSYVDELSGEEKLALIDILREVSEGKIYLEVPRARITRTLAGIKEANGDINAAHSLMQDLQVETFGSMERREKIDFILEQIRLTKVKEDWDLMAITAKKINTKWIDAEEFEDLKLRYYNLMISYALHEGQYLNACKYFRQIYNIPSVQADDTRWPAVLRNATFFVILAPYDNEQSDLLHRITMDERLQLIGEVYNLAKSFTTPELMRWPGIQELYGSLLRQTRVFGSAGTPGVDGDLEPEVNANAGEKRWEALHNRVVEHNVRMIAKYYTRITLNRLTQLLDLTLPETEEMISRLVISKTIYARIDRPAGLVNFQQPLKTDKVLNEWSNDVEQLMKSIEKTTHLISKEYAVYEAKIGVVKNAA